MRPKKQATGFRSLTVERMEPRYLLSSFRSIDGSGNNLENPHWGQTGSAELRVGPADFADGLGAPAGEQRENARVVSNRVNQQTTIINSGDRLTDLSWVWGQFINHEVEDSATNHDEPWHIEVPQCDPLMDPDCLGDIIVLFLRSEAADGSGQTSPREYATR